MKLIDFTKFKKNKFLKNVSKMLTGTILGQIISIITVPIASRIYGAELYGDLAVFTSSQMIIVSLLGFGLGQAIMVEKSDKEAGETYKLSVITTNFIVVFVAFLLILFSDYFQVINTNLPYPLTIILLAFAVITTNQINMLYAWLNRKGRYNILLFNPMVTPIVNNGIVITLGLMGYTNIGLYIGLVAGQLITLIHMIWHRDKIPGQIIFSNIKSIIIRNKDFIVYQYPSGLINNVVGQLPVQILSNYFGNTVVGYYSITMKLINIPANLISNSLGRVYFKEVSDKQNNGENARAYTLRICKIVMGIFAIPTFIVLILGDWLVPLILGNNWHNSIPYLKIMIVWNLFSIGLNSTAGFTSVIGMQKENIKISIFKLCYFPISMLVFSYLFNSSIVTVFTYAVGYSIINILFYNKIFNQDYNLKNKYFFFNIKIAIACLILTIIISFIKYLT